MAVDVEALARRYGPMVLRRCRQLLRHEQEAVEVMQDVFVQVLVNAARLDDHGASSLLWRIATNLSLNKIRSRSRHPEDAAGELLQQIASASAEADRNEAKSLLDTLLRRQPATTGTIAVLHLHDGMTLEQVAKEVGLSVSGVRKRLRKLKDDLASLEAGDKGTTEGKGRGEGDAEEEPA